MLAGFSAAWSSAGRAVSLEFEGLNVDLKCVFAFLVRVAFIDCHPFPVNAGSIKFSSKINFKLKKKVHLKEETSGPKRPQWCLAGASMVGSAHERLRLMRMGLLSVVCCLLEGSRSC